MKVRICSVIQIAALALILLAAQATVHAITPQRLIQKRQLAAACTAAGLWQVQVALIASIAAEVACDPELCVVIDPAVLVAPEVPATVPVFDTKTLSGLFKGPVSDTTAQLYQRAAAAQLLAGAHEMAVLETVHRIYTASVLKNDQEKEAQEKHKVYLIAQNARKQQQANVAWLDLLAHMREQGIDIPPLTSDKISEFLEQTKKTGLPDYEVQALHGLRLSDRRIATLSFGDLQASDVPTSFLTVIEGIMQLNQYSADIDQCTCEIPTF